MRWTLPLALDSRFRGREGIGLTDFAGPDLIRRRRSLGIARPVAAERQANLTLGGGVSNL
jgi:hypothetical protein